MDENVLVYGAYGHTGRFVVAAMLRQGLTPVLSGRDPVRLAALAGQFPGLEVRQAAVSDSRSLSAAVHGASVVVNCAGPFLDTAIPVMTAAVRAGAHYLDITAEQPAVQEVYRAYGQLGARPGAAVIPAMAFYGGLPDLLATAAMADIAGVAGVAGAVGAVGAVGWQAVDVDEVTVVIGLDRWWPTEGTRITGRRNTATRLVVGGGHLVPVPQSAPRRDWEFPAPLGRQAVTGIPFSEIVVMARHLSAQRMGTYLSAAALEDIHDPATPAPEAVDAEGRSAQRFAVDVVVRRGAQERRISAAGRDIYAVTAPLVAEAARRLIDGRVKAFGAVAPGEAFDAADFLAALSLDHLAISGG